MSDILKRKGVTIVVVVIVITLFAEYFFQIPGISSVGETIRTWAVIVSAIALGIGVVNIFKIHMRRVQKRAEFTERILSGWLIILFIALTIMGLINEEMPVYKWIFNNVYSSIGKALYSLTGFYIASAAYRAFRARSIDSAILLVSGCIIMLTNATIGQVIWSGIPIIGGWIKLIGQTGPVRSLQITGALGVLAYGFRVLLGKEKSIYGEVESGGEA